VGVSGWTKYLRKETSGNWSWRRPRSCVDRRGSAENKVPAALTQEQVTVPIAQEAGWVPGTIWTDVLRIISIVSTGIRIPNCLSCSQSLHRLH
jgi:hypothetical protein